MGQGDGSAGADLLLELGHHAAVGAQHVAEADGGELGVGLGVAGLDDHFRQPFGGAHHIGGVDGLICRNEHKALDPVADRGQCRQIGAEHVVFDRLIGAVLHEGHMLVGRRVKNDFRAVKAEDLIQPLLVPDGADAKNQPLGKILPVFPFQIGVQIVHIVFADIVQHNAFGLQGEELAAQFAADASAAAGDQDGLIPHKGGYLRHIQLLLRTAQQIADVQLPQRAGSGTVSLQILQRCDPLDTAAGGQAFFDHRVQIVLGGGNGDDDIIDGIIAGQLENVAAAPHHGNAAETGAGALLIVIHHDDGQAVAVIAVLHFMHHVSAQPACADDHGSALTGSAAGKEGNPPPGDGITVDQPGGAHQRHADEPEQRIDQPVQAEKILGPHKIIGRDGIQIGADGQRQRGQNHAEQVLR